MYFVLKDSSSFMIFFPMIFVLRRLFCILHKEFRNIILVLELVLI